MKRAMILAVLAAFVGGMLLSPLRIGAATPGILSYQGRVLVGGAPFPGPSGLFKFALVDTAGTTTFWSNNGTSVGGSEPNAAVTIPVANGLYSVLLGDAPMQTIPASVFNNDDVRLRIWFDDGKGNGSKQLSPDQRIAPVGYAQVAKGIDDGAVTNLKIADGAVTDSKIAAGTITASRVSSLPKCRVYNTNSQSFPPGVITLTFPSSRYDTNNIHPSGGTRLTCNTAGVYRIFANLAMFNNTGGTFRSCQIVLNGTTVICRTQTPGNGTINVLSTEYMLSKDDYVEVTAQQDTGTTFNINGSDSNNQCFCEFGMSYVP